MSTTSNVEIGTFVAVSLVSSETYWIPERYWDEIDAAFHNFIERRIDKLLSLTTLAGAEILIPVSRIGDVGLSTPETRDRTRALDRAMQAEQGFTE